MRTPCGPGPPYEIAATKSARLVGLTLDDAQTSKLGTVFHYGLAISWTPCYIGLPRRARLGPLLAGLGRRGDVTGDRRR